MQEKKIPQMKNIKHYESIDDVLKYFLALLPEAKPDRINSVVKYAKVNNEEIKVQAIKRKSVTGFSWTYEITLG